MIKCQHKIALYANDILVYAGGPYNSLFELIEFLDNLVYILYIYQKVKKYKYWNLIIHHKNNYMTDLMESELTQGYVY